MSEAAAWAAALMAGLMAVPQAARVRRLGAAGVSLASWQALLWATSGWLGYGLVTMRLPLIACNTLMTSAVIATVLLIQRDNRVAGWQVWIWPFSAVILAWTCWGLWGELGFLTVMIVPSLMARVAQLATTLSAGVTVGLSISSLLISASAQVLFFYYGLATDSLALVWANVGPAALGFITAIIAARKRYRLRVPEDG